MLKRSSNFEIRKRPQSFTDLQKSRGERTQRKPTQSITGSTVGSAISRPIMRNSYNNNLYIPYKTTRK